MGHILTPVTPFSCPVTIFMIKWQKGFGDIGYHIRYQTFRLWTCRSISHANNWLSCPFHVSFVRCHFTCIVFPFRFAFIPVIAPFTFRLSVCVCFVQFPVINVLLILFMFLSIHFIFLHVPFMFPPLPPLPPFSQCYPANPSLKAPTHTFAWFGHEFNIWMHWTHSNSAQPFVISIDNLPEKVVLGTWP